MQTKPAMNMSTRGMRSCDPEMMLCARAPAISFMLRKIILVSGWCDLSHAYFAGSFSQQKTRAVEMRVSHRSFHAAVSFCRISQAISRPEKPVPMAI
eukprot:5723671-Pyramimonas_sp.AAC.2